MLYIFSEPVKAQLHLLGLRQLADDILDVILIYYLPQRPSVIDIVNPHEAHELAVILCSHFRVITLLALYKQIEKIRTAARAVSRCKIGL